WRSAGVTVGGRSERSVAGKFARIGRIAVAGREDPGGGVRPCDGRLQRDRTGLRGRDEVRDSSALFQAGAKRAGGGRVGSDRRMGVGGKQGDGLPGTGRGRGWRARGHLRTLAAGAESAVGGGGGGRGGVWGWP